MRERDLGREIESMSESAVIGGCVREIDLRK